MRTGRTLNEMAREIERQAKTKKDYVAKLGALEMTDDRQIKGINGGLNLTQYAHQQLGGFLDIPWKYYEKMLSNKPELLAQNVNVWLNEQKEEQRMVRTLDGNIRAILSRRYRPLDNYDLAEVALPILQDNGCEVVSCELTDTRMYIKAITPKVQSEIKKGDIVQAGLVISNSEVGAGAVRIEPMIYRLVCLNGMIAADSRLRKYHIGKGTDTDDISELLTSEAKAADDKAFWLKVRDIVRAAFAKEIFECLVSKMVDSISDEIISNNLPVVVEVTAKKFGLGDEHKNSILTHLIKGGELNRFGMVNAITRTSQDIENYDIATDFERLGGKVLELPKSDWQEISEAA